MAQFESGGASRLEPLVTFISHSKQARYDAESENLTDLRKWHHLVGSNLLFASEVIQMDGVSMSETVTAHAVRVGENSQQPDGHAKGQASVSVRSMDGARGGPAARSALSPEIETRVGSQKTQVNKAISRRPASSAGRASEGRSEFIPILPADISAGDGPDSAFRFLGSKTDPILHVSYPTPWNLVADFAARRGENLKNSNWRCLLTLVGTAILPAAE